MSRRYTSRRYAGGLGPSRIRTRIPTTRQLGQWVSLRKTCREEQKPRARENEFEPQSSLSTLNNKQCDIIGGPSWFGHSRVWLRSYFSMKAKKEERGNRISAILRHRISPESIGSRNWVPIRWRSLPRVRWQRASKRQGISKRVLPWQVTMNQLIGASLSHTH